MTIEAEVEKIEYKIQAFQVSCTKDGKEVKIPNDIFQELIRTDLINRWEGDPLANSHIFNLLKYQLVNPTDVDQEILYQSILTEITLKDKIDLMKISGEKVEQEIPPKSGTFTRNHLVIAPKYDLVVLESTLGIEKKLSSYLNYFAIKHWNPKQRSEDKIESIIVKAIPRESDPSGFLRSNQHLGSFEAVINSTEFENNYGALSNMFTAIKNLDDKLIVKISISSGRGKDIPEVFASQLADFLDNIEKNGSVRKANVRETKNGKKFRRPTTLLDAIVSKVDFVDDTDEAKFKALIEFSLEIAEVSDGNGDKFEV